MPVHEPAPTTSRFRVVAAVGAFALLAGTAVYATAFAADPAPATCFTYTDPAGDANLGDPMGFTQDDDLDLVGITHAVEGAAFVSKVKVMKLSEWGSVFLGVGDRFKVLFTINKHAVTILAQRDTDPIGVGVLDDTWTRVTVDAVENPMKVTVKYDVPTNTVSMSVPVADLEKAVGVPLLGATISALTAESRATFNNTTFPSNPAGASAFPSEVWDTADAGAAKTSVIAEGCGSGTASAPTDTGTPTGTATASPTPPPTSTGTFAGFDNPRKKCFDTIDPADDSNADLFGVPTGFPGADGDTELTGMVGRTLAGKFKAFIGLKALTADGTGDFQDGDIFTYGFTVGGKAVVISATRSGGTASAPTATVAGKDAAANLKPTATYDTKNGFVVLAIDQDGLASATGATVDTGTVFTATKATSTWVDLTGTETAADTVQAAKAADQIYTVGPDACFYPPAGKFDAQDFKAQYGDAVDVGVTLNDSEDNPAPADQTVIFKFGSKTVSVKTDGDGFATALVPNAFKAGKYPLTISYAGSAEIGPVTVTKNVAVVVEKAKLGLASVRTGSTRTVKATLSDDDRHAVTGQVLVFSYGSKKVSVRTDSHGVAQLKGVKPGTSVTVSYAGASGMYSAVKAAVKA